MKNNLKRLLSIFLLLSMLAGLIPCTIPTVSAAANASANVVEMVLDYAKPVEIPKGTIRTSIECDANTETVGLLGIVGSGTHNNIVTSVSNVSCQNVGDTFTGKYGTFTRVDNGLSYQPTVFMGDIEKAYLIYKIKVSGTAKYIYVELRLVPATAMYYETDFSDNAVETISTDAVGYVDNDNAFYADFTNTALDKQRYKKNIYGGKNYDLADNWGALDADKNGTAYTDPKIENGHLIVDFRGQNESRNWIWVQANGDLNEGFTLNYHPHESHVVQIRLKFHDLVPTTNATPYANLYYFTGVDRWEGVAEDYGDAGKEKLYHIQGHSFTAAELADFNNGEYITITFPVKGLSSDSHTLLSNLRFQIGNVKNTNTSVTGGMIIDYVYIGPAYSAPENQPLYFDFGATVEDTNHYGTHNYLNKDHDAYNASTGVASAWNQSRTNGRLTSLCINPQLGTLDITGKVITSGSTAFTFGLEDNHKISYNPANAEVLRMRLKLKNFSTSSSTAPTMALTVWDENGTSIELADKIVLPLDARNSDEFFIVELPIPADSPFRSAKQITDFDFYVTGLISSDAANLGVISIDYLYIGSLADALALDGKTDYLLYDFSGNDTSAWTYVNAASTTVTADPETGTIQGTVNARDPYVGIPFTKASDKYVLKADDVVIVRLKVDSGLGSNLQVFFAVKGNTSYGQPVAYRTPITNFTPDGKYQTIVLKPNSDVVGKTIMGMRVDIVDAYTTGATGNYEIDYVYLGPDISADTTNHLYFDFENSADDQVRYATEAAYAGKNYDTGNWKTQFYYNSKNTDVAHTINNTDGTISCEVTDQAAAVKFLAQNLSFNPKDAEVVRVRFRLDNMMADANSTKKPFVRLWYNGIANSNIYEFDQTYISNSHYLTIETALDSDFRNCSSVTQLNITFHDFVLFDPTINGKITIDYIYVGTSKGAPYAESTLDYMYFDFKNSDVDQARYANNPAYGGFNYDIANWATGNNGSHNSYSINHDAGTISVAVKDISDEDAIVSGYGPYFATSNVSGSYPWGVSGKALTPLNFPISKETVVKIRFKTIGCSVKGAETPNVRLLCHYTDLNQEKLYTDNLYLIDYTYKEDQFTTLTFKLSDYFLGTETLNTVGFRFRQLNGGTNSYVVIDYIYVGTEENFDKVRNENNRAWQTVTDGTTADNQQRNDLARTDKAIFFDFGNTSLDRVRYSATQYKATNYDDPNGKHWFDATMHTSTGYATQTAVINNSSGTLTLTPKTGLAQTWTETTQTGSTADVDSSLQFDPAYLKTFQIRFKVDGLVSNGSSPVVRLQLHRSNGTMESNRAQVYFDASYIDSGTYLTLTASLGSSLDGYETITGVRVNFVNMQNANDSKPGKITIDYIYVGPEEYLPTKHTYGYDASYANDSKLSNGSSRFVEGRGIPLMNSNNSVNYSTPFSETSFSFTGKGFDLISRTGANQGAIRVAVYDSDGYCVKTAQVINKSDLGNEFMQVPVLSVDLEKHDTYHVKIFVAAPYDFDDTVLDLGGALDRGGEFYFDAVRIYSTINTASSATNAANAYKLYQKHGEADPSYIEIRNKLIDADSFNQDGSGTAIGAVYLDAVLKNGATFQTEIAKYAAVGPNNEVYLEANKAIAFKIEATGTPPASVDIAAKSADGTPVSMNVVVSTSAQSSISTGTVKTISSSTAQYYSLGIYSNNWKVNTAASKSYYLYVMIQNKGSSGILSLTDIKFAYDVPKSTSTVKSARILVDDAMVRSLTNPCDHVYVYTNNSDEHTVSCALCDDSVTEAHIYTDGTCICGATEAVLDNNLTFNTSISVGSEMQVVYTVTESTVRDYESFYLEVTKSVANGENITTTFSLNSGNVVEMTHPTTGAVAGYQATYTGIYASEMGDDFTATLYAVSADGSLHYSNSVTSSIKSYLTDLLNEESTSAELKTLAVDMLNYGAAAQEFFGYDTENLVNADLTDEQQALGTQELPDAVNSIAVSGTGCNISADTSLQSKVLLYLTCLYASDENSNLRFVIKDADGKLLGEATITMQTEKACQGLYENVGARQMRELLTIELYDGDTLVSKTLTWSVESYVASIRADQNSSPELIAAANAMLIYGDSAARYLKYTGQ